MSEQLPKLAWWCQPCRSTGMLVHCADPNGCGSMLQIPHEEAAAKYAALAKASPDDVGVER